MLTLLTLSLALLPVGLASDEPTGALARPAGLFTVGPDERGVWAFAGRDGRRFVSLGVNNVAAYPHMPRAGTAFYNPVPSEFGGDKSAWSKFARQLLLEHGFNTVGCWSEESIPAGNGLYHTPVLYVSGTPFHTCLDVFRPDFAARVRKHTTEKLAKFTDREHILGVFLDNEMPWWGKTGWDRIPNYTLLERALEEPADHPVHQAALGFLKDQHSTIEAFGRAYDRSLKAWSEIDTALLRGARGEAIEKDRAGFTALVAERYYKTATEIVRELAPGVLILGTRFAGDVPDGVIVACGKYCDVISFNDYHGDPTAPDDLIARVWVLGKRPMMITEFAWRARENQSGNPNTAGAGAVLATQAERAERYGKYLRACLSSPVVIGLHWFEFADQSPQGRFDGENSNYGIVDIHNKPYAALLGAMREANRAAPGLRAGTLGQAPKELPRPKAVRYVPGQFPGRPPTLDLLGTASTAAPEIWGAPDSRLAITRDGSSLTLNYTTGMAYGAGISMYGPQAQRCESGPGFATDLDGYVAFEIDADIPRGLQVNLILTEAGSGPVGAATYASGAGDDGEAFISDPFYGEGTRRTYTVRIGDLKKQTFWGNQAGSGEINMSAIKCFGLQLQGSPETGAIVIRALRLSR